MRSWGRLANRMSAPFMNKPNIETMYPLTLMQEGMLYHELYAPESRAYFQQVPHEFEVIDYNILKAACEALFRRHGILRTLGFDLKKAPLVRLCPSGKGP